MRRWYVPLTVLGLGGVSAFLLSGRGRTVLRRLLDSFGESPESWLRGQDSLENELENLQAALNRIADSLNPRPQPGH